MERVAYLEEQLIIRQIWDAYISINDNWKNSIGPFVYESEWDWDWAKNQTDNCLQWVWLMGKIAEVDDVVKFQKGYWDCSDAGMLFFWLPAAIRRGLQEGTVDDIKALVFNYIDKNPVNKK